MRNLMTGLIFLGAMGPSFFCSASTEHELVEKGAGIWSADFDLAFYQQPSNTLLGFVPSNGHPHQAGLQLSHADIGYQQIVNHHDDNPMLGRFSVSYHNQQLSLAEIYLDKQWHVDGDNNRYGQLNILAGNYLPRIGFENHKHTHDQLFSEASLLAQAFWGSELLESGIKFQQQKTAANWSFLHSANILGANHLTTTENSPVGLYQAELGYQLDDFRTTLLANYYYADVINRGLFLFDSTRTHVHSNSGFSEFFSGTIEHLGMGVNVNYKTILGQWGWQTEYAQRSEKGELTNATTYLGYLDSKAEGGYHMLTWKTNTANVQVGLRYDFLISDVVIKESSDNSLDSSLLNAQDTSPKLVTLLLAYELNHQQKVKLQYQKGIDWADYKDALAINFQQSFVW